MRCCDAVGSNRVLLLVEHHDSRILWVTQGKAPPAHLGNQVLRLTPALTVPAVAAGRLGLGEVRQLRDELVNLCIGSYLHGIWEQSSAP